MAQNGDAILAAAVRRRALPEDKAAPLPEEAGEEILQNSNSGPSVFTELIYSWSTKVIIAVIVHLGMTMFIRLLSDITGKEVSSFFIPQVLFFVFLMDPVVPATRTFLRELALAMMKVIAVFLVFWAVRGAS